MPCVVIGDNPVKVLLDGEHQHRKGNQYPEHLPTGYPPKQDEIQPIIEYSKPHIDISPCSEIPIRQPNIESRNRKGKSRHMPMRRLEEVLPLQCTISSCKYNIKGSILVKARDIMGLGIHKSI